MVSIADLIPYEAANLFLRDNGEIQVVWHRGYQERGLAEWINDLSFPYQDQKVEIYQKMIETGKPKLIPDTSADPEWVPIHETSWIKSYLGVPIQRDGQVIGFLNLDHSDPDVFQEKHLTPVSTLANQISTALENAHLYRQQKKQVGFLESLRQIDIAITGSMDLQVTLEVIMAEVMSQLEVDAVSILLYDDGTQSLELAASSGHPNLIGPEGFQKIGQGLPSQIIQQGKSLMVEDLLNSKRNLPRKAAFLADNFQGYFGLPLKAKGKIVGVMELFRKTTFQVDPEWINYAETVGTQTAIAVDNSMLFTNLQKANRELTLAYDTTLEGWAGALELRDHETEGHSRRVVDLTMALAKEMGIPKSEWIHIKRGALLHDIGKMGVPDEILQKPGKLSDEEQEVMRRHPLYAEQWLKRIRYLRPALNIPIYHHERWDGSGYPYELKQNDIPLAARLFAVVDVWDALNSDRPYRDAWLEEDVKDYLRQQAGIQFDPEIVETFLEMIAAQDFNSHKQS
jgi:HD-GYP domain-containing protein (c-di-GMP phosphodiesterase class II)